MTLAAEKIPSPLDVAYRGSRNWRLRPDVEQAFHGGKMTVRELAALGRSAVVHV